MIKLNQLLATIKQIDLVSQSVQMSPYLVLVLKAANVHGPCRSLYQLLTQRLPGAPMTGIRLALFLRQFMMKLFTGDQICS